MYVRAASLACALVLAVLLVPSHADAATTVRVAMVGGAFFDIELNDNTPLQRDNFLNYVNTGRFTDATFHRSDKGLNVLQGGGFSLPDDPRNFLDVIPTYAPVAYEGDHGWSNTLGTIGAARSGDPNSATSQWYINMADNSSALDDRPGIPGYTVFGKIVVGLDVVQALFAKKEWDFTLVVSDPAISGNLKWLPLASSYTGGRWPNQSEFLAIASANHLPEPATMAMVAVGGLALLRRRGRK
jgi:peptidyl-prolyl cis-trans isomerase A (cyclophilin A)